MVGMVFRVLVAVVVGVSHKRNREGCGCVAVNVWGCTLRGKERVL